MFKKMSLFLAMFFLIAAKSNAVKPNIILILADDMGYSDIGCFGGEISTPNLDRLASEGARFRSFYNNSKCTTTRASLMSGQYPNRAKGGGLAPKNFLMLPEAMKLAGYRTILSGKWHLGNREGTRPMDRGFDESYGLFDGCSSFFYPTDPDKEGFKTRFFGHNDKRIEEFPEDFYTTDAFTDHALAEIKKSIDKNQPYFLHLAYTAPHYPLHAPAEDIAKYRGKYKDGWEALRQSRYERMKEMGVISADTKLSPLDSQTADWSGNEDQQELMEVHAAMVDRMDQNIGRILKFLDETGTAENTLIFFLSDNGASAEVHNYDSIKGVKIGERGSYRSIGLNWANACNTPFKKFKLYGNEGGMCTPFIVRWPGVVPENSWNDSVAHIIDFQPTLMSIAGLNPNVDIPKNKDPLDGENILAALKGENFERANPVFMEFAGNRGVRDGDWKLSWINRANKWELYNLANDRTELNDLSKNYPEKVTEMDKAWKNWANETGLSLAPKKPKKAKK